MTFISEKNAFQTATTKLDFRGNHTEVWNITFLNSDGSTYKEGLVGLTLTVLNSDNFRLSGFNQEFWTTRALAFQDPYPNTIGINYMISQNSFLPLLHGEDLSNDEIDILILGKTKLFYEEFSDETLSLGDLTVSIYANCQKVFQRAKYWGTRGYLGDKVNDEQFSLNDVALDKIDRFLEEKTSFVDGGYFKEVQLTQIHDKPYVFVLMPFREEEFPQNKYEGLLKSVLEDATGVNCLRADDRQNARLISDQIFTQIKRAKVLIAEISSLNPNVMIEIGVALTLGKQVFMFHDINKLAKEDMPFYVWQVPFSSYSDDDEFERKLRLIELPK